MLRPGIAIASALAAMLLAAPATAGADGEAPSPLAAPPTPAPLFSPDLVIVEWAPGTNQVDRVAARDEAEVTSVRGLGDPKFQLVRADPSQQIGVALEGLRDDPNVRVASRDSYSFLNSIPNDPLFGELWGLRNLGTGVNSFVGAALGADINAPLAWDRTIGSPSVVIADLDSGYRFDSPDLGPVAWINPADPPGGGDNDGNGIVDDSHGADFVGTSVNSPAIDGDPTDDNLIEGGHGVHTAGTMGAAGNNAIGISGVAQNVRIMPLRVCSYYTDPTPTPDESGTVCPTSSQILAINYAGSHGARVANMSLGGTTSNNAVRDAFAANPQTLFVISAGNDGPLAANADNDLKPHYPCNYNPTTSGLPGAIDNIICVAATNQADGLASFSDWGLTSVDLGAPGTETLSTYPGQSDLLVESFEASNFSSTWSNTGAGFGRASAGDGPLTSFGMNDSPGGAAAAVSVHSVTLTNGISVPAGSGACTLSAMRFRHADPGSTFSYSVLSNGSPVFTNTASTNTAGSSMVHFNTAPITGLGGTSVKVSFSYTAGGAPTTADGIWLDDITLTCNAPLSTPPGYEFLQGTSMAAPHVTGAAGLLFSLKPLATVAQVRAALLAGVDPVSSLAGKTTSGGRLDVLQAMNSLEGAGGGTGTGGGGVVVVTPPPSVVTPIPTPTPACTVPKLTGKTLGQAKAALSGAGCTLGTVTKPKARKGKPLPALVVKSSTPAAGASTSGKVGLKLGPKPKPKKHHR